MCAGAAGSCGVGRPVHAQQAAVWVGLCMRSRHLYWVCKTIRWAKPVPEQALNCLCHLPPALPACRACPPTGAGTLRKPSGCWRRRCTQPARRRRLLWSPGARADDEMLGCWWQQSCIPDSQLWVHQPAAALNTPAPMHRSSVHRAWLQLLRRHRPAAALFAEAHALVSPTNQPTNPCTGPSSLLPAAAREQLARCCATYETTSTTTARCAPACTR